MNTSTPTPPRPAPSSAASVPLGRRQALRTLATALGTSSIFGLAALPLHAQKAPAIRVLETCVISPPSDLYHGWPTVARRANGDLWVSWSGGREAHVCPFGQVWSMHSTDEGRSWTWPRVLLDGAIDDRDSGLLETQKGTLLVTTFTSLAYESSLTKQTATPTWAPEKLARWKRAHERLSAPQREAELGEWLIRSTDGGITWSERLPTIVNSPHGPIHLQDGRLLYAGKQLWTKEKRIGVCESLDDGKTWRWLADIQPRSGDAVLHYHELHAVEAANGTLVVQIRNHNPANNQETLQCESSDGGKTWSEPRSIGVWGLPSHLLRLRDDRLLMTYGHRRRPFGTLARISSDHGKTWSDALAVSEDAVSGDLGYPSTVQLKDGALLTIWYEKLVANQPATVLRQARWILD